MAEDLRVRGASLLGGELRGSELLGGGDLSEVVRIELRDGRSAVVKCSPSPAIEADMLRALRKSGAPAPSVLAFDANLLVLEWLPQGGSIDRAWGAVGATLATLHSAASERYGWSADYAFGAVAIENGWLNLWPDFWADRRLRNQAEYLPHGLARRVLTLADDLHNRLPARPKPVLLHGDLWSGNVLVDNGQVSGLIDPACYYGDREVDFAMLRLFSRPDASLFGVYGGLEAGHQARLPIYQLWPALVHLRLFGSGYLPLVERLMSQLSL